VDQLARHLLPSLPDSAELGLTIRKPSALPFAIPSISITRSRASYHPTRAIAGPSRIPASTHGVQGTQGEGVRAFIALGSNIGDRVNHIRKAVNNLEDGEGVKVTRTGRMYESEPMYVEDQDRFINTVIEVCPESPSLRSPYLAPLTIQISTTLEPLPLLRLLKTDRKIHWAD